MSQQVRQSNIFAAEDWKTIYRAFSEVNFNAYDFDTIRQSMTDYIQLNYPEDFNDWIDSAEFVALIDLLAYLGQSLAFRMDLNTRDNFIDDAIRRQSILNLATFLSYVPSRNIAGSGLLKVSRLMTNDDVIDSSGNNLNGNIIIWNDASNPDWFEQFILVLNAALEVDGQFGQPVNQGTVNGFPTQGYVFNSQPGAGITFPFTANVDGSSLDFEIVNTGFTDGGVFFENTPDPNESFTIVYQSDGNGNTSPNTGFFCMFKQGSLSYTDNLLDIPLSSRNLPINVNNINNTDVWVQTVQDDGSILTNWTQVPSTFENNIIFNNVTQTVRNIYSVVTLDNDQIQIQFADSQFGAVPTGIIRTWYRASSGTNYTIRTQDITNVEITLPYINSNGITKNLTITFSLQSSVNNSSPAETDAQIQQRAPAIYYTRNRMVNGEDYNVFPLSDASVLKAKAINRTYSGHSRYIDINDPTANYQNTKIFSNDGIIYTAYNPKFISLPVNSSLTPTDIIDGYIIPMLSDQGVLNFFYKNYLMYPAVTIPTGTSIVWNSSTSPLYSSSGVFQSLLSPEWTTGTSYSKGSSFVVFQNLLYGCISTHTSTTIFDTTRWVLVIDMSTTVGSTEPISVNSPAVSVLDYLRVGTLIKFQNSGWASIVSITNNGNTFLSTGQGTVTLSSYVDFNDNVVSIIPSFDATLNSTEIAAITTQLEANNTFGIRYDVPSQTWVIINGNNLDQVGAFDPSTAGSTGVNSDNSWIVEVIYTGSSYQIYVRSQDYIFESDKDVRFFFTNQYKTIDFDTGLALQDQIKVLAANSMPSVYSAPEPPVVYGVGSALPVGNLPVNRGQGYSSAPSVVFSGDGIGASATALVGFGIEAVVINSPGSGYIDPPNITFTQSVASSGSGATAVAELGYPVSSITMSANGSGYTGIPVVTIINQTHDTTGSGATGTAILGYGLNAVNVIAGGTGYGSNISVVFSGGSPISSATGIATIGYAVSILSLTNGGSGYTLAQPPSVIIAPPASQPGIAATATPVIGFGVASISLTSGQYGSGYTSIPTVTVVNAIGDTTGTGATAQVTQMIVVGIGINGVGSGYASGDTVILDDNGTVNTTIIIETVDGSGGVLTATIVTAGLFDQTTGVPTNPVSQTSTSGSGIGLTINLSNGVNGIELLTAGSGYTSSPTIVFSGTGGTQATSLLEATGSIVALTLVSGGNGYNSIPAVSFTSTIGSGASAIAQLSTSGSIKSIIITQSGYGYQTPPVVEITGPGASGATGVILQSVLNSTGVVVGITLNTPGSLYTLPPIVTISGDGGSGATATSVLNLSNGGVANVVVTNPGSSYDSTVQAIFSSGSSGGGGSGVVSSIKFASSIGSIIEVIIDNQGEGYTFPPTISFVGGGGTGANFETNLVLLNQTPISDDNFDGLGNDYYFDLQGTFVYPDGYIEPRRVLITFADGEENGIPDNPEAFYNVVGVLNENDPNFNRYQNKDKLIFEVEYTDIYGYEYYKPDTSVLAIDAVALVNIDISTQVGPFWPIYPEDEINSSNYTDFPTYLILLSAQTNAEQNGVYVYNILTQLFTPYTKTNPTTVFDAYQRIFWVVNSVTNIWTQAAEYAYQWYIGRNDINFLWTHYAPFDNRIDPAIVNIIDIYVLTSGYDTDLRNWISVQGSAETMPTPPTETDLKIQFASLEEYKMISDQIVWHPAEYQLLFGNQAALEYQVTFEAIKIANTTLSDGEIKVGIIAAINSFFAIANWDFGDTFYFTELAAYIHLQLPTALASIVIVPSDQAAKFGNLFQIQCQTNQIFISCATVDNVTIVNNFNKTNLRIGM